MTYILLIFTLSANLGNNLLRKKYASHFSETPLTRQLFNAILSMVSLLVLLIWGGFGSCSLFTLLLGTAFGIVIALHQIFYQKAIGIGPLSYTAVAISLSTLIPTLSGVLIWHETIVPIQIFGILLMLVCLICSVGKEGNGKKFSTRWLLYCAVSFLCNGLIGVMQKWHQSSNVKEELSAFLLVAFAVSLLYSSVSSLLQWHKEKVAGLPCSARVALQPIALLITAVCGVCVACNHRLNLYLSGVLDSAVFFPIVNGGGLILVTVSAVIFFRERLSIKQWIGIMAGILSVVLLCNPFA